MKFIKKLLFLLILIIFTACKTMNFKIGDVSFSFEHYEVDDWTSDYVLNDTYSDFLIKNDGKTQLYPYSMGTYALIGTVTNNNGETHDICLIVDTGCIGNIVSQNFINKFSTNFEKKYKFVESFAYLRTDSLVDGVIIPTFATSGMEVHNMLFQTIANYQLGKTENGIEVDGYIGLKTLSAYPFLFSAKNLQLIHYNYDNFSPKGTCLEFDKKKYYQVEIPISIKDYKGIARVDTGAPNVLCGFDFYKKYSANLDGKIELRHKNYSTYWGLLDKLQFLDKTIYDIPFEFHKKRKKNQMLLGISVLRNFDLYLDYQNSKIYFESIDYSFQKHSMRYIYYSNGNRAGDFGINIKQNRYSGEFFIESIYYKDGKKLVPNLNIKDKIVNIYGSNGEVFDLKALESESEIRLLIKKGNKIKEYNLKKNILYPKLEY